LQLSETQSPLTTHVSPSAQPEQSGPPQSTSVSTAFNTPSTQLGAPPVVPLLLPLLLLPLLLLPVDASPVVPLLLDPPLVSTPVVLVPASLPLVMMPVSPLVIVTSIVVLAVADSSVVVVVGTVVLVVVDGPPLLVSVVLTVVSVGPVPRPSPAESKLHAPSTTHPTNQARAIHGSIRDRGLMHELHPRACPREPTSHRAPRPRPPAIHAPRCSAQHREFAVLEGV